MCRTPSPAPPIPRDEALGPAVLDAQNVEPLLESCRGRSTAGTLTIG
jgi:hypothetical protein